MNMLKRSLAMMLVLCMLFSMAPITAFAEETTDPAGTVMPAADGDLGDNILDADQPNADQPDADQPDADQPAADEPVADEPAADEPAGDEPAGDEPAADEPAADQPAADQPAADEPEADEDAEATEPTEDPYGIDLADFEPTTVTLSYADTYRILHLDCGRKYFTKDWIKALINEMAAAGFTHLELAFGNDGLRFLLDDMSVGTYSDAQVTAAIQQGNKNYYDFDTNELTQAEMDAIITHANSMGIKIIPLLNNPGHMNAIVSAASSLTGGDAGYNGSSSTVDLENTTAVDFVKGLVEKYVAYFDGKGCNEFNFGADEYANDVYSTGSMGFGALTGAGKYQLFVDYVNEMAAMIKDYGMVPIAFNDGIYFNQNTSYNFDKQIMVAFWTSGWSGYQSASASTMAGLGHEMINVNGDYYYVLGKSDQWDSNGYTYAANWSNTAFMGSTVSNPMGGMFCIWCDLPGAETETQIAANTRMILRAMVAEMQGKDANSVTDEVIPGGFNADGTIAETREWITVPPAAESGVQVSGYDLTSIEAVELTGTEVPAVEGAEKVLAWDITPYVGTEKYTDKGDVHLPVPAEWNSALVKGFYVENGEAILVDGTYADGYYTFRMPHFSVGGIAEISYDKLIELTVGGTHTETLAGVDLSGQTFTPDPAGIATVTVKGQSAVTGTTVSTTPATTLEAGATYIIRVYDSNYALSSNEGRTDWGTSTLAFEYNALTAESAHLWTLEASGSGYKLKNEDGYLNLGTGNNTAYVSDTGEVFTLTSTDTGWTIGNGTVYINALGGLDSYYSAGGWTGDGTRFDLYKVMEATDASTTVTFTGDAAGETYVTINGIVYKIVVHGNVDITIKYVDADGNEITTKTVEVADNATSYTLSNFDHDGKYYMVENKTLNLTPGAVEYTVTVTESAVNWDEVEDLTIEYFITNQRITIDGVTSMELDAQTVYSEAGVDFAALVPASDNAEDPKILWRGWLLPEGYHQAGDNTSADMCTSPNGTRIQKIRYWDGAWQYFNGTDWVAIKDTDQVAAYYVQQTQVTDEVTTSVTDWGETFESWSEQNGGAHWFWSNYVENGSKFVFLDFAVVYEDGTQTPTKFPQNDTWFFHFENCSTTNPRVLKPMVFTETADYEIWKVTVTDGTSDGYSTASSFTSAYDNATETVVWTEDMGGTPRIEALTYTANQSGKLIRIYVRAVAKEDTLKVVYYDEKFADTLYQYDISVVAGKNFNTDADGKESLVNKKDFASNTERIDVTNAYIVNALDKEQYFQTDLTKVPEAVGKYNNGLYTYTGSKISDDGKTITHYYTINTNTLSPNFVADFGLPLSFPLSQVLGENQEELVESVTVNEKTRYGTLAYNETSKTFTYTPTEVLQNIDVLSINIKFEGETEAHLTNVGVTPATTVYYGEQFLNFSGGWISTGTYANVGEQAPEVLGESSYYGYDDAYENTTGASDGTARKSATIGDTATFTFTGTGIQVFANASDSTGYVSVMVKNKETGAIKNVSMVDTVLSGTANTDTTGGQIGKNLSGLPVVSLVDLTGLEHGTYDVTITKVMDSDPVYIDGIRVFETVEDQKHFLADEEDNPDFYEVRDLVMKAIGIQASESVDYKTMFNQIYADTVAVGNSAVITSANAEYGTLNRQDLLDNGPKNELYLFNGDTLTMNVSTNRVVQLGLKAPEGSASFTLNGEAKTLSSTVDMFYKIAEKGGTTHTISITNTGGTILSVTLLKICDDPNVTFPALTEENIKVILANAGYVEEPEAPTYTLVELKGTDVLIDGTVFDYTGEAIEPAITVNVGGTQLVEGKDYSVTYTNNVEPGTATVTIRGIATASETLGYTGEVSIDYTINAPAEPEVPEETTKPTEPTKPVNGNNKPGNNGGNNKPGQNKPTEPTKPGNSNKPGQSNSDKKATLKITFVNLIGRKVGTATLVKTGAANERCFFSATEIGAQAPVGKHVMWFLPVVMSYGGSATIIVPVI